MTDYQKNCVIQWFQTIAPATRLFGSPRRDAKEIKPQDVKAEQTDKDDEYKDMPKLLPSAKFDKAVASTARLFIAILQKHPSLQNYKKRTKRVMNKLRNATQPEDREETAMDLRIHVLVYVLLLMEHGSLEYMDKVKCDCCYGIFAKYSPGHSPMGSAQAQFSVAFRMQVTDDLKMLLF
jgi:hypothetical protein